MNKENIDKCKYCMQKYKDIEVLCDRAVYTDAGNACCYDASDEIIKNGISLAYNAASFLEYTKTDDVLSSLYAYFYMMETGCFTLNDRVWFNSDIYDESRLLFPQVIMGDACCRHICEMYKMILNFLNKDYNALFVRGYTGPYVNDFNPRRNKSFKSSFLTFYDYVSLLKSNPYDIYSQRNYGNHSVVHAVDGGRVILLDPTNLFVFNYVGKRKCNIVAGNGSFTICGSNVGSNVEYDSFATLEFMDSELASTSLVTATELKKAYYKVVDIFDNKRYLLDDFKCENEDLISAIVSEMAKRYTLHK